MAASLENCLQSLHSLLQQPIPSSKERIEVIIEDLKDAATHSQEKDFDYTCALLFDKDKGITRFLHETAASDELQNGKANALDLLSSVIQKGGRKILAYAVDIKEACLSVYSRDRFAKVKNAAIPALVKLLEVSVGSSLGEDLKINKMIEKFFTELTKASKLSMSVKAGIYHLLGVIGEVYPDLMAPYSARLAGLYVSALKAEMTAKTRKPELGIIAGCLDGLCAFMVNFTQSADEDSKHSYEIFKYVRMAIDPKIVYTRYDVPRAGLRMIGRHAEQLRQYLMDDYEAMYDKLYSWSHHANRELLHLGIAALDSFMKEVCTALVEKAKAGNKEGGIFKFFLLTYRNIMSDSKSTSKEVSTAIRGYGMLAAPCRSFLSESDTQFMFTEMVNKCEHQFLNKDEDLEERLMSIPSYLNALSCIIRQIDTVSAPHALVLEHLVIVLIENFSLINQKQHFICIRSILLLLLTLMRKATVFQNFLSAIIYQGLIRTCSHQIKAETSQSDASEYEEDVRSKHVSYKDFIPLWTGLFDSSRFKELANEGFSIADRNLLTETVYNEFMVSAMKILTKLDLEATPPTDNTTEDNDDNQTELTSADPVFGVTAKKPLDFQIFINLVDLCRDLLEDKHCNLFQAWVYTFCHSLIVMSTRHPLVSGLYKLLAIAMKVANRIGYFQGCGKDLVPSNNADESMDLDTPTDQMANEIEATYQLIMKFSKEVLVRMKQYRDDLLASCLTFILAMPKEIVCHEMKEIVYVIQMTFTLGLSYLPLAQVGLDALESWSEHLPRNVIEPYYVDILPTLDPYLKSDVRGTDEIAKDQSVIVTSSKSKSKAKMPVRLVKETKTVDDKMSDSLLLQVKKRILTYLGTLGGQVNHELLAHSDTAISDEAIAWDTHNHLRFDVPFFDMKPTIYFDPFLPHVVQLAQLSSDRQTKVAACELLHSLVLYALGRGVQMSREQQEKYPMNKLYRKLFPPLLSLACDVEQVCKDLFEPLVLQLIHWFTNNKMAESPETMALLDAIYDSLIQNKDTALRDFSARCLKEFLQWSLKQASKKAVEKNPINAKSVLKRMYSFALHPNAFKRLGAALAFNNIYMVFREEESLVDRFTFDILHHFVESLAMAHRDPKSLGTQEQCSKALNHLERIIKVKADILKKDPGVKVRPEPSSWSSRKLEFAVRWLTRQCGRPETECRHVCMKLVFNLCTDLPGIKIGQDYFKILFKVEGAPYFLKRFEGGGHGSSAAHGLLASPTLDKVKKPLTISSVLQWFDHLLAVLDCYCWVLGEDLLNPLQLFTGKGSELSCIFQSLTFFLEKVASHDLTQVMSSPRKSAVVFTPSEMEEYSKAKCTVVIRMWNFLSVCLAKHSTEICKVSPKELWSEKLWKLLAKCILQPTVVGFNMADTEIMLKLPKEMSFLITVMSKYLPKDKMSDMKESIKDHLKEQCNIPRLLPVDFVNPEIDQTSLSHLANGYTQLINARILDDKMLVAIGAKDLSVKLLNNVFKGIVEESGTDLKPVKMTPAAKITANSLLSLALQLQAPPQEVVKLIMSKAQIRTAENKTSLNHGDLFFHLLKSTLVTYLTGSGRNVISALMDRAKEEGGTVSNILITVLDHVARDKTMRKKEGTSLCDFILSKWNKLESWWSKQGNSETQSLALMVFTKILLIDSQVARDVNHASFAVVFDMYLTMLLDSGTPLGFKNRVLDLLPFFATVSKAFEEQLKSKLNRFVADNFPLQSSEFVVGTAKYSDYITAIKKLLVAMEMSGNTVLLELIISVLCRESNHVYEREIQESISNFIQRLPAQNQKLALDVPFSIFEKEGGFPCNIRRAAIEKVCLPMLRLARSSSVVEFFSDHIHNIMDTLDSKLKSTESALESQLISKLSCFQLLEVMFSRLTKDEVNSKTSLVNQKFCHDKVETGKEMTMRITKASQEAKSEDVRGETMLLELRRQYHCHAYNLLVAIISCVQTDLKFYKGFLFQDNTIKGQFLIDNIIDKEKKYEFQSEFVSPLERRRKFVAMRKEAKEQKGEEDGSESSSPVTPSLHLASQFLAGSSLSSDLSQYDFHQHASGQASSFGSGIRKQPKRQPSFEPEENMSETEDFLELEMDVLNNHECMPSLVAVFRHIVTTGISPQVPKGTSPTEMPVWMSYFHDKMKNPTSHINVKLFIAKLVQNCSKIFQPYAKFWFRPLCQLLLAPEVSDGGMSYFVVDLIVSMLSWHTSAIPEDSSEERAMAFRVVKFIMSNVYHTNKQIFRNNLDLLKTVLECWHDRVDIPYDIVYSLFKIADPRSPRSSTGVQVLGVVLSCKFPAYGPSAPVEMERYLSSFANLMGHHLKSVHAAAAEVVGLVFHRLAESKKETEGPFHEHVAAYLSGFAQARPDHFVVCIHGIHKQYPSFTKRFLSKLLFMLPNLHGEYKAMCLEVIGGHVNDIENVYLELSSKGLVNFLTQRDEVIQLVSLKIVKSIMMSLKDSEMASLLPCITAFSSHANPACRMLALEILMWVFDNYRSDEGDIGSKIMMQTKEALLLALCDEDVACRLVCQNFWSSNTRLPEGTLDRTVTMLEAMYSPSTEVHFLSYATNLLLEATSKSPDYQRLIYEHPLSDCRFEEYPVRSSWHQRHAVMTPLFAATLVSQSMSSDLNDEPIDEGIRATQDAQQFTATMDVMGGGKAFNWLTQSSLDTFAESTSMKGETQLLFSIGRGQKASSKFTGKGLTGREKKMATVRQPTVASSSRDIAGSAESTDGENSSSSDIWRLKKRFLKDKDVQAKYFAKRNVRLNKMKEAADKERKVRRENQVTMYRKYRTGDLPDIQIKYQYVIAPLQALANRDNKIANLLFSSLFTSILDQLDKEKTEREMEEMISQVKKSLENIFHQSIHYFSPFIGSILIVLYNLKSTLKVSSDDLVTCAVMSGQQNLGILVLEEQLIHINPKVATTTKRAKYSVREPDIDTAKWIELSRLYKSVRETDALQGVFSDKLGTKDITRKAIEAEAGGDFKSAKTLYEEAASCNSWSDGDPLESEIDFWDDGRMECLNALCNWEELESVSVMGFDTSNDPDLDRVWDDAFSQEHYLPFLMRSKVKRMLEGATNQQPLLSFVDKGMTDEAKKQHLQSRFCEELAMLTMSQKDYGRAKYYTGLAIDRFMQDWISTSSMMTSNRKKRLCQIQTLVEMQEFLQAISSEDVSSIKLYRKWENRSPHMLLSPVDVWDDIVTNRSLYLDLLNKRSASQSLSMDSQEDAHVDNMIERVEEMQVKLKLAMAESCLHQNNLAVTLKLLRSCHSASKKLENPHCLALWVFLYSRTHHSKARSSSMPWNEELFKNVIGTIDQLTKLEENLATSKAELQISHKVCLGQAYDTLADGLLGLDGLDFLSEETLNKLKKHADGNGDSEKLVSQLISKGYDSLEAAISLGDVGPQPSHQSNGTIGQANLDLSKYCDKYLRLQEDEKLPQRCGLKTFPKTTVVCLLNAMNQGSLEARERFPRLLQLAGFYPDVQDTFISKVEETPCWMFLMWVGQMTALMDKPEAPVVAPILTGIGQDYPQALIYPFCMSIEGLRFGHTPQDKKNKLVVERLKNSIDSPVVSKFICALEQFTQPDIIFKDWADGMRKLISCKKKETEEIKKSYKKMYTALLNTTQAAPDTLFSEDSTSNSVPMGDYRKKFATKFKSEFDKYFGAEGKKLISMSPNEYKQVTDKLNSLVGASQKGALPIPKKVKEYSTWMAEFTFNKVQNLEIPGQYTGIQKPMPEYHIYIAGFNENVLVMSSLRKPKRITIRGNDERDHLYLVKGGEDLRMDQRVENLFYIMNKVMSADPVCSQRKLHLTTYQVIPMTPRIGLIEWMSNTCPLKDFLYDSLTDEERKYVDGPQGPKRTYMDWTSKVEAKNANFQKVYDAVCMKYNQTDTQREFRIREGKVPWDLSRRAIHNISSSPEAFHVLRSAMVSTHATICMCQYLLGIGDRHLSNFMVNLKTGHMVGIDFGHNFGTATQFLPVPEMIPFRLTRQLINLNLPMQVKGQMEGTMRHVLRALRNDSDLLFSTMDIFVKEPSVDWLGFADKQMQFSDSEEGGENWYPKQKIEFAKRKLIGDHPSHIMKDELTFSTHSKRPVFKYFSSLVLGNEKEHVRAKLPAHGLTVEQQVAALIDQATDPNILGRTWIGWEPWF